MQRCRATPAVLGLACLPLAAQSTQLTPFQPFLDPVAWPALEAPHGRVHGCVGADLTGSGVPDVALWTEAGLFCSGAPNVRREYHALVRADQRVVTDVAVVRGAPGARDALVGVGPDGLFRLSITSEGGVWVDPSLDDPLWLGANGVRVGDLDGDGAPDFVGRASDGRTLLMKWSSLGWVDSDAWTQPSPIHDLIALDWDGLGGDELAVATTTQIAVLRASTTGSRARLAEAPIALQDAHLARVVGAGKELFACAYETSVGGQVQSHLAVFASSALPGLAASVSLGGGDIAFCTTGDVDGDGASDVLVGYGDSGGYDLFVNRALAAPGLPMFADEAAAGFALGFGSRPPDLGAAPALVDIDGDGDGDLAYPAATLDGIAIAVDPHVTGTPTPCFESYRTYGGKGGGEPLEIRLQLVEGPLVPDGATELEVSVWRLVDPLGALEPGREGLLAARLAVWELPGDLVFALPASEVAHGAFFAVARWITRSSAGVRLHAFPASLWTIVVPATIEASLRQRIEALPTAGPSLERGMGDGGLVLSVTPIPEPPEPPSTVIPPTQPGG
jgi:hypothetical protein